MESVLHILSLTGLTMVLFYLKTASWQHFNLHPKTAQQDRHQRFPFVVYVIVLSTWLMCSQSKINPSQWAIEIFTYKKIFP